MGAVSKLFGIIFLIWGLYGFYSMLQADYWVSILWFVVLLGTDAIVAMIALAVVLNLIKIGIAVWLFKR